MRNHQLAFQPQCRQIKLNEKFGRGVNVPWGTTIVRCSNPVPFHPSVFREPDPTQGVSPGSDPQITTTLPGSGATVSNSHWLSSMLLTKQLTAARLETTITQRKTSFKRSWLLCLLPGGLRCHSGVRDGEHHVPACGGTAPTACVRLLLLPLLSQTCLSLQPGARLT